jgi:Arc/MetJ-type ribon-helix-helix transcriptional regulator
MFENMSEFVGYAMHDDLLMRRMQDARVAEAQRALQEQRRGERRRSYREVVAMILIGLARRIAPSVTTSKVAPVQ